MKRVAAILIIIISLFACSHKRDFTSQYVNIIPTPKEVSYKNESFFINLDTKIWNC